MNPLPKIQRLFSLSPIFYLIFFLIIFIFPAIPLLNFQLLGGAGGDTYLYLYLLESNILRLLDNPFAIFNADIFYPMGLTLAFSDNLLLPSCLFHLFNKLGLSTELSFNLLTILASLLNGCCTFLLAKRFTDDKFSAIFSGSLFMSSAFLFSQMGHHQLQYAFFIPLAILALLNYFDKQTLIGASTFGLCIAGSFLCSIYYTIFIALIGVILFPVCLLLSQNKNKVSIFFKFAFANIPYFLLFALLALPYQLVKSEFGGRRISELSPFSATISSYFATPPTNIIWGSITKGFSNYEGYLFLGSIPLLLALIALLKMLSTSNAIFTKTLKLIFPAGIVLLLVGYSSSESTLQAISCWTIIVWTILAGIEIYKKQKKDSADTLVDYSQVKLGLILILLITIFLFASFGISTKDFSNFNLFVLIHKLFPGFNSMRVPSRLGIVVVLIVSVLAGRQLGNIKNNLKIKNTSLANIVFSILFILSIVELINRPVPMGEIAKPPLAFQVLKYIDDNQAVLALPFGTLGKNNQSYINNQSLSMYWLKDSNRPSVNGYSGIVPKIHEMVSAHTKSFPDSESLDLLSRVVGLKYIIFNPSFDNNFSSEKFEEKIEKSKQQLSLIEKYHDGTYLFELHSVTPIQETVLLLPPSFTGRYLSFKIRSSSPSDKSVTIRANQNFNDQDKEDKKSEYGYTLTSDNNWADVVMQLPPSSNQVRPHKVLLTVQNKNTPVFIKNLKLIEIENKGSKQNLVKNYLLDLKKRLPFDKLRAF